MSFLVVFAQNIDGPALPGGSIIYQGNPSIFPKGHLWTTPSSFQKPIAVSPGFLVVFWKDSDPWVKNGHGSYPWLMADERRARAKRFARLWFTQNFYRGGEKTRLRWPVAVLEWMPARIRSMAESPKGRWGIQHLVATKGTVPVALDPKQRYPSNMKFTHHGVPSPVFFRGLLRVR